MSTAISEQPSNGEVSRVERTSSRPTFRPSADITEGKDELTVFADMAGVDPANIDIQFEKGTLTIHGRVDDRQSPETNFVGREFEVGDFLRTFQVSEAIDAKDIHAEYEDGVLILHLPKTEAAKPRRITVSSK
jgi:HSP20 family molecular chaperone IbpA